MPKLDKELIKAVIGLTLFIQFGGVLLAMLGFMPALAVATLFVWVPFIGQMAATTVGAMIAAGLIYLVFVAPIAIVGASWTEDYLRKNYGFSVGVSRLAKKGKRQLYDVFTNFPDLDPMRPGSTGKRLVNYLLGRVRKFLITAAVLLGIVVVVGGTIVYLLLHYLTGVI